MASPLIDTGDQRPPGFEEQMRAAEQEAGVPSDAELYGEFGESAEPDEAGRVPTTRDDPVEAEAAEEAPPEEPVAAEAEVPDQLAEVNKKLGQLLNENADLRRQMEAQPEPAQPSYIPTGDTAWFEEYAAQNPQEAAYWALQNQQPLLYDHAIRAYYDVDAVAAGRYERQVEQQVLMQNMQSTLAPQIQGAQQMAAEQELSRALTAVAGKHPDFEQVMSAMTPAALEQLDGIPRRIMEEALANGSQADKEQFFETLYHIQKSAQADVLVQAARETPVQQQEQAREAKREAFVGSASTSAPDETVVVSESERMAQAWANDRASLRDGWTGKDGRGQRLGR